MNSTIKPKYPSILYLYPLSPLFLILFSYLSSFLITHISLTHFRKIFVSTVLFLTSLLSSAPPSNHPQFFAIAVSSSLFNLILSLNLINLTNSTSSLSRPFYQKTFSILSLFKSSSNHFILSFFFAPNLISISCFRIIMYIQSLLLYLPLSLSPQIVCKFVSKVLL